MKTFLYTVTRFKNYRTVKVYRSLRNIPRLIDSNTEDFNYCSDSDDMALQLLRKNKQIPRADISPTTGKASFQLIYLNVL